MKGCKAYGKQGASFWTAGQWTNPNLQKPKKPTFVWKVKTQFMSKIQQYPLTYTNWYKNEPNNVKGNEACIALWPGRKYAWNDTPCTYTICSVCQMTV